MALIRPIPTKDSSKKYLVSTLAQSGNNLYAAYDIDNETLISQGVAVGTAITIPNVCTVTGSSGEYTIEAIVDIKVSYCAANSGAPNGTISINAGNSSSAIASNSDLFITTV